MNPAFSLPFFARLARVDIKVVLMDIVMVTQLGAGEPLRWEFILLSFKIMSSEHPQLEHFLGREVGSEITVKMTLALC